MCFIRGLERLDAAILIEAVRQQLGRYWVRVAVLDIGRMDSHFLPRQEIQFNLAWRGLHVLL
jgi:hypothetical protein